MNSEDGKIQVMELFGPTIQGEGIMTGTITHFLRTGGCPLRCKWCDSMFAVDPKQVREGRLLMGTHEILAAIKALPPAPYITFTGGDPAIQQRLGELIPALNGMGMRVAVETQGMYFPVWLLNADVLTFSPKGPSSGNVVDPMQLAVWLTEHKQTFKGRVCIKIVVKITGHEFTDEPPEFPEPPITEVKTDLEYAMRVYRMIPEQLYDAFYFTALTPPYGAHADGGARILDTVAAQRALVAALQHMLVEGRGIYKFNHKTHVGVQQHVLLWPEAEMGV